MRRDPIPVRGSGRATDRAFVLPVAAFLLLTPPILGIFNAPVLVFGIPLLHVYCFAVWILAIAAGGFLAHRMAGEGAEAGGAAERPERS